MITHSRECAEKKARGQGEDKVRQQIRSKAWAESISQSLDKVYKHGVSYLASKICLSR